MWILAQECPDSCRCPARFGSLTWNERETHYSQAKLELYGLFRALCALCLYLVGVKNLVVEMDAQFIRGMLKNPDIQPNATITQWIATILLFDFNLVHMPVEKHCGPDGLLRCEPTNGGDKEDNPEEWIDDVLSLGLWVVSWSLAPCADHCVIVWTLSIELTAIANDPGQLPPSNANDANADHSLPFDDKTYKVDDKVDLMTDSAVPLYTLAAQPP